MGDFNGEVTSIASIGEFIYVGGEFTSVSGIAVNRIARYLQGRWYPLRQVCDLEGFGGRGRSLLFTFDLICSGSGRNGRRRER